MPRLEMANNETITGGRTVARYLAREHGVAVEEPWQSAQVDMLVDSAEEMRDHIYKLIIDGEDKGREMWLDIKKEKVDPLLELYSKTLKDNDTGWFVGPSLSWCDLVIFDIIYTLRENWDAHLLNKHENLEQFIRKIYEIPSLKEYLDSRPYCIL